MPEIRFQITDIQAELLRAVAIAEKLPETELSRRAWARGLFEFAGEHPEISAGEHQAELLSTGRPGALPDDTLRLIASMADRSLVAIVAELERQGIPTARGGHWTPTTVARARERAVARGLGQGTSAAVEPEPEPEPAQEPPKRRGRPRKSTSAAVELAQVAAPAKRRGRRAAQGKAKSSAAQEPPKRRGRPRKSTSAAAGGDPGPAKPRKTRSSSPRRAKG